MSTSSADAGPATPSANGAATMMGAVSAAGRSASVNAGAAAAARDSLAGAGGGVARAGASGAGGRSGASAQAAAGSSGTSAQAGAGGPSSSGASAGAGAGAAGHQDAGAAGQGAAGMAGVTKPSTWRVAFLGDSITETSCTSQLVFAALRADGHTNFDLVGTKENQQGCGVDDPDRDVEGHSGYLVTEIVGSGPKAAELPMWCTADRADLVLMHFGTNDAWTSSIPIMDIVSAYSGVVAALRAAQPHVIVLVAQIIPLSPDNCSDCESRVRSLNDQIPMWAAMESTPESPIFVVDQWTGFDSSKDANDRVHPNMQGSQKMADVWLAALHAHNIF